MKLVFMGTPQFAVPSLRALAGSRHEIAAVVTNPDRPAGRGRKVTAPPIKPVSEELELELVQPPSLRDPEFIDQLSQLGADLFVVVAFSILPRSLLRLPMVGSVNLHPSLLPAYRGAAPIVWALFNGDTETGVTSFLLTPRVDAGDVLIQERVAIQEDETAGELEVRLRELGARVLVNSIDGLEDGTVKPVPQSAQGLSQARKLTKEDGRIDWKQPSAQIHNLIRGANPTPGAFCDWQGGQTLKIHRSKSRPGPCVSAPGTVVAADEGSGLQVATGDGALELTQVQPAGKPSMDAAAFLRGHQVTVGMRLGR
jgi:methionyl-tRNA formyltransferase